MGTVNVVPAVASTLAATLGNVAATLTYQKVYPVGSGGLPVVKKAILTIRVAGHLEYRGAVFSGVCGSYCWPAGPGSSAALRVVRLAPGSPDVVLGLYSGGAHCCFVDQVFSPGNSNRYVKSEINLGDPGARLLALSGNPYAALITADDSFAYAFTDFAASGLPIRIERFGAHRFTDVTRRYPSLIRADASQWLRAFYGQASTRYEDSVGVIAAWTADEYLLGNSARALRFLNEQATAGHLNSLLNPTLRGALFVTMLEKFLQRGGY